MKKAYLSLIIGVFLTATVYAANGAPTNASATPSTTQPPPSIQSKTAGGSTQTTIIDSNGNLKVVDSAPNANAPVNPSAPNAAPKPSSSGMQSSAPTTPAEVVKPKTQTNPTTTTTPNRPVFDNRTTPAVPQPMRP